MQYDSIIALNIKYGSVFSLYEYKIQSQTMRHISVVYDVSLSKSTANMCHNAMQYDLISLSTYFFLEQAIQYVS